MPTTEERLAALEAKLAQLTDTTPTTYYEHQYSGEEIDNAVSRALPNGAIDQSVGTFVRPNLLDNWYFGRPVNQRDRMIQLAGTMLYSDAACTQAMFPSTKTTSIIKVSDIAAHPSDDSTVYVKLADCVRGYTGAFVYTIDRWQLGDGSISLSVAADGIVLKGGNNVSTDYIYTRVERLPVGKYTFSVLFADNTANVVLTTRLTDISVVPAVESREASGVLSLTWDQPEEFTSDYAYFRIHIPGSAKILAAKLELGSTQTLAHREGDKWIMNEVPEYGEQLRRCLRHDCIIWSASQNCPIGIGTAYSNDGVVCVIQLPEYMRTNPAVVLSGEVQIRFSKTQILTVTSVLNYGFSGDKVQLYFPGLSGLTPGQSCDLYTQIGSRLEFNSNL